ncbi:MAG: hypothetical protein KAT71_00375 [Gammaproteobacteria bacterium]|nr:hypothetical protein [Gammaproteobacteria bacterium]
MSIYKLKQVKQKGEYNMVDVPANVWPEAYRNAFNIAVDEIRAGNIICNDGFSLDDVIYIIRAIMYLRVIMVSINAGRAPAIIRSSSGGITNYVHQRELYGRNHQLLVAVDLRCIIESLRQRGLVSNNYKETVLFAVIEIQNNITGVNEAGRCTLLRLKNSMDDLTLYLQDEFLLYEDAWNEHVRPLCTEEELMDPDVDSESESDTEYGIQMTF